MQNTSACPQCGQIDQTKSVFVITQSGFTINATIDGRNISGDGRSNLSQLFSHPKPFGHVQQILLFTGLLFVLPITVIMIFSIIANDLIGNTKMTSYAKSFYTIIPDSDYQLALQRYNESFYCARCGIVFHPQSGMKEMVTQGFNELEWKKYLYHGTSYGRIIAGN